MKLGAEALEECSLRNLLLMQKLLMLIFDHKKSRRRKAKSA
jgi:hypothetical protein